MPNKNESNPHVGELSPLHVIGFGAVLAVITGFAVAHQTLIEYITSNLSR
jgi:hypothetical protein